MSRASLLSVLRRVHLYLGVFIAPAIVFFAVTGALQTFGLHETNDDHPSYVPQRWIVVLGALHKHQTPVSTARPYKPAPAQASPATTPAPAPKAAAHHPLPLRLFFLLVSIGLLISTATGLWMTWVYQRNRRAILLTLAAGVAIPLVLCFV